jgi:branched-subunit amino acid transport protein
MSSTALLCLVMLVSGLLTFAARAIFLLGGERLQLGPRFRALLAYVPPAVLAALIAPEIFVRGGHLAASPDNPRLWAALIAVFVALYTRSVLATITFGLLALWALQGWLGIT